MVMAGFFFARAGVRPIIFLKEVLDYQARHPEQHDQQSFNQVRVRVMVRVRVRVRVRDRVRVRVRVRV